MWFGEPPETEETKRYPDRYVELPIVAVHLQEILDRDGRRPDADNVDSVSIWISTPQNVDTADHLRALAGHLVETAEFLDAHRLTGYWRHFAGMPYEEFWTLAVSS